MGDRRHRPADHLRHLIPNAAGVIVVNATLTVANAMLIEAALSFLGFGIQPPHVALGTSHHHRRGRRHRLPWLFYFPAIFLVLAILSVNFVGDGLRDALDPTPAGARVSEPSCRRSSRRPGCR